jgi:hypothetical protein
MPEARPGCSPNPIRHIPYFVAGFNGAVVQLAAADEQKEERRTRKNKNNPEVRAPGEYFQCCNSGWQVSGSRFVLSPISSRAIPPPDLHGIPDWNALHWPVA